MTHNDSRMQQGAVRTLYVGIDCGKQTGFAIWDRAARNYRIIQTLPIHKAMALVETHVAEIAMVCVEDARQVRFGTDPRKMKGAGSVCRDAVIWQDFLTDKGIPFTMVRPNRLITKLSPKDFMKHTGYLGSTSSHARDAAMLVFQS